MNDQNRTYTLITGGSMGIGFELARIFASNGHNLILVARDELELRTAVNQLQMSDVEVIGLQKDLFEPNAAFELYDTVTQKNWVVDILVNNAGQGQYGLFKDTDINRELDIIQLNICSLVVLTKKFLAGMLERGEGKILNLSSIASKAPGPWQSVYHGTKAFIQSFSEALHSELKEMNITVTALLPGTTDTDFFNKAGMLESKAVQDEDDLADPAKVAKDGYEALMRGDDKVISGFKNKMTVAASNVMTDSKAADTMSKKQEPVDRSK
ncbi:MAG: oxidoreductase [Bacteroidetes bacterium]|nr:MAG: oxidoreductase [Bacteroidota bacterium]